MIMEVGFGLCAICLPTCSGALRISRIQKLVEGFVAIISSRSRQSTPPYLSHDEPRQNQLPRSSESEHAQFAKRGEDVPTGGFEMHPVQSNLGVSSEGIRVIKEVEWRADTV